MRRFQALSLNEEVLGVAIASYKDAIDNEHFASIYEKHGFATVDPNQWYPYQTLLDVFNDIAGLEEGVMFDFVSIGMKIAEKIRFPANLVTLIDVLQAITNVTQLNLRGTDIGYNKVAFLNDKHATITYRSAMPDDMMYGIYYAHARRFLPKGTQFRVYYDETAPRRDNGAEETILHINWD